MYLITLLEYDLLLLTGQQQEFPGWRGHCPSIPELHAILLHDFIFMGITSKTGRSSKVAINSNNKSDWGSDNKPWLQPFPGRGWRLTWHFLRSWNIKARYKNMQNSWGFESHQHMLKTDPPWILPSEPTPPRQSLPGMFIHFHAFSFIFLCSHHKFFLCRLRFLSSTQRQTSWKSVLDSSQFSSFRFSTDGILLHLPTAQRILLRKDSWNHENTTRKTHKRNGKTNWKQIWTEMTFADVACALWIWQILWSLIQNCIWIQVWDLWQ